MRADEDRHLRLGGEVEMGGVEPGARLQERKCAGERQNSLRIGERLPDAEDGRDASGPRAVEDRAPVGSKTGSPRCAWASMYSFIGRSIMSRAPG